MVSACEMCQIPFVPEENGADETYCSYSCATGGGSKAPAETWACGGCPFEDNTEDEEVCAACLTPRPELKICQCCETIFREDETDFAPFCARACWLAYEEDDDEEVAQTCAECSAPFNVETWRGEFSPFCSYGCWCVNQPVEDEEEVKTLAVRMPPLHQDEDYDEEDYEEEGGEGIAPASILSYVLAGGPIPTAPPATPLPKAIPVPLNRLKTPQEQAITRAQAETRAILYHLSPIESYIQLEDLVGGRLPEGVILLDPFTNYLYTSNCAGTFQRLGIFDPWSAHIYRVI